jgi:hypothetical protein
MNHRVATSLKLVSSAALSFLAACDGAARGPLEVRGTPARSFSISVGHELQLAMGGLTVAYVSPPALAGTSIAFVSVVCPGNSPGGCTQLFTFKGVQAGQTIITFHSAYTPPLTADVIDTVSVY